MSRQEPRGAVRSMPASGNEGGGVESRSRRGHYQNCHHGFAGWQAAILLAWLACISAKYFSRSAMPSAICSSEQPSSTIRQCGRAS